MPSERQLAANRRNAALGGPKTPEGRAAVRFNALVHGLCADTPVLPGEDGKAFEQFREDLFQDYLPANYTERLLFEDFAICSWRLVRLRRVETAMWSAYITAIRKQHGAEHPPTQSQSDRAIAGTLAELPPDELANYFRYERAITRDFYRTLHELESTQRTRRRSRPVPAREAASDSAPVSAPQEVAAAAGSAAAEAPLPAGYSLPAAELSDNGIGTVSHPSSALSSTAPVAPVPQPNPADTPQVSA